MSQADPQIEPYLQEAQVASQETQQSLQNARSAEGQTRVSATHAKELETQAMQDAQAARTSLSENLCVGHILESKDGSD
jgi:hypothetical protein